MKAVAAILAILSGELADATRRRTADWYPLGIGTSWTYSYAGGEYTQAVVGHKRIGGVQCAQVEIRYQGHVGYTQYMTRDSDGVRIFSMQQQGNESTLESPMTLLKIPFRKGQEWTWKGSYFSSESEIRFTDEGEETLEVLGRKTPCRKVAADWLMTAVQMKMRTVTWFAQGIGVAKIAYAYEFGGGGAEIKQEILVREFKPARR